MKHDCTSILASLWNVKPSSCYFLLSYRSAVHSILTETFASLAKGDWLDYGLDELPSLNHSHLRTPNLHTCFLSQKAAATWPCKHLTGQDIVFTYSTRSVCHRQRRDFKATICCAWALSSSAKHATRLPRGYTWRFRSNNRISFSGLRTHKSRKMLPIAEVCHSCSQQKASNDIFHMVPIVLKTSKDHVMHICVFWLR